MKFTSIVAIAVMFTTVDALQMKQKAAFNQAKLDKKIGEAMQFADAEAKEVATDAEEIDRELKSGDNAKATKTAEKYAKKINMDA